MLVFCRNCTWDGFDLFWRTWNSEEVLAECSITFTYDLVDKLGEDICLTLSPLWVPNAVLGDGARESVCAGEGGGGWGLQAKQGKLLENKNFSQKCCKELVDI